MAKNGKTHDSRIIQILIHYFSIKRYIFFKFFLLLFIRSYPFTYIFLSFYLISGQKWQNTENELFYELRITFLISSLLPLMEDLRIHCGIFAKIVRRSFDLLKGPNLIQ